MSNYIHYLGSRPKVRLAKSSNGEPRDCQHSKVHKLVFLQGSISRHREKNTQMFKWKQGCLFPFRNGLVMLPS